VDTLASLPTATEGCSLVEFSVFDYCYRDASNYKAWGTLLLQGACSNSDIESLRKQFDSGEFFIAEQLGIPPLYAELWEFSNGPSIDDHVWHTFYALRPATKEETNASVFGTVENFVSRIKDVKTWDEKLSPHWDL
jgi:hypothetical protein